MLRRSAWLSAVVALAASAPASGHGRAHLFPTLRASAGAGQPARRAERRVRGIESSLLGRAHAAEHARQRAVALRLSRRAGPARRLEPDNSLAPRTGGVWSPSAPLPVVAINAILLRTGKVLIFAYPYRPNVRDPEGNQMTPAFSDEDNQADAYVFDPATGQSRQIDPPVDPATGRPAQIFCAGASTLPDGRVLVVGGDVGDPTETVNQGLNTVYTFDPGTETWQEQPRLRQGRWYPSQLEMADGRTVIMSGATRTGDPDNNVRINTDVEIFSPDNSLQRLQNLRLDRFDDNTNANGQPAGPDEAPFPGQYPHLFWMPGGHALVAGPRKTDTWRFHPPTPGADDASWTDTPDLPTFREWAAAALLPGATAEASTRVMLFGGADRDDHGAAGTFPAVATTTVFDDANPAAGWVDGPALSVARAFANSVLLPDGEVAVVGGGTGENAGRQYYRWENTPAQQRVDRYDPVANAFVAGNAQAEARTYHSSALLLPDARVLSAGDDINGPGGPGTGGRTDTAELWSPPYLFTAEGTPADRPEIDGAPAAVGYGQPFLAATGDDVARAVLVAPGASTHNTDMSQRVVALAAPEPTACGVRLQSPAGPDLAPPGYYMLFLLDAAGTPSKAAFVRLGADAAAPAAECPTPPPGESASPAPEPSPAPTVTPAPTADPVKVTARAARTSLRTLRRTRRLTVRITVSRASAVRVSLLLRGRRVAAPQTVAIRTQAPRRLRLRLTKAGRLRLLGRRRATLALRVTAVPTVGDPATVRRRVRLGR